MNFRNGCFVIILVIALAGVVSATEDNFFIVSDIQGMPGDTITIPIKMQNAVNVGSGDLGINTRMDCPYGLRVISMEKGSLTSNSIFDWKKEAEETVADASFASSQPITGSGSIIIVKIQVGDEVTYSINQGTQEKKGKCHIYMIGEIFDINGNPIGFNSKTTDYHHSANVYFSLGWAIKGDGDHDGVLTSKDAMTALQIASKKLPQNKDYDMNGDGVVKANDAMEILKLSVTPATFMDLGMHKAETPAQINKSVKSGSMQTWKP